MSVHEESPWPVLDRLVDRVLNARRMVAAAQAAEAAVLAEAVDVISDRATQLRQEATGTGRSGLSSSDLPLREVSLELGAAMRVSDRTVQARISDAFLLTTQFARTFTALSDGEIDAAHATAIVRTGVLLSDTDDRARYESLALDVAATESPARMTAAAKAIAATICPEAFAERARAAAQERAVRLYDLDEGLARLIVDGPAPLLHAAHDRLTTMGRSVLGGSGARRAEAESDAGTPPDGAASTTTLRTEPSLGAESTTHRPDPRTLDQVRADLLCELLLTGVPTSFDDNAALGAIMGRVQVTVPALTLAGDPTGGPALLAGYGPIDPDLARRIAGLAPGWDRVFTDPYTGEPLAVDRYRPSAQLQRYLAARDEHCRTPGCRRRVHQSDVDHTVAAADGGATDHRNLACLCRRHHVVKHCTAWRVRQLGHGVLEWTGPTGRRYIDRPPATVRFVPAIDVAPF
ncbi:HNH endonuclease signature motif containing protein [uncultured Microbacterium sp.]|uniref:HNH endonuclease signature motif containing protein n=1 Tax=uncultured Microbacterium sp. TaxID=191216 RepID=UPI00261EF465|nr:HNH endonuclease signature motif containing protein [uncultured Microbacterium sp.]